MAVRAVTFDVYAALFDTHRGLTSAFAAFLDRRGVQADATALARAWREGQRRYLLVANSLELEPASNRRAIEAALHIALRPLGIRLRSEEVEELVAAWERLPPWPETAAVLEEVRRRPFLLATLSNGDEEMLRRLLDTLPVRFDVVVSTEGGRFKPHPSAYQRALERLGLNQEEVVHVAGSAVDAVGATAFGIRTVWVRRYEEELPDPRFAPAHEVQDLWGVLSVLDAIRATAWEAGGESGHSP